MQKKKHKHYSAIDSMQEKRVKKSFQYICQLAIGFLLFAIMFVAEGAVCQKSAPVAQMQCVSVNLIGALEQKKSILMRPGVVSGIINQQVVPYFDIGTMARSVVGRRFWYGAKDPSLQREFITRFKRLVISTYSAAIEKYDGDKVKFYPLRNVGDNYQVVSVKSLIMRPSGQNISVTYKLRKKAGRWVVFDFSIENISMVQSYQSQFKNDLNQGGLKALVANLRKKQGA
jgi:phospholipid transport system substrate-binding protein